ncbi:MAG: discoidin domain-containing protein [Mycobacteriales bacterium]
MPAAARGYTTLDFTILQTSNGTLQQYDGQSGVGLAELSIPGVRADEVLRLPTDLFTAAGTNGAGQALTVMLTRDRVNPQTPYKTDPELSMAREFTLPTTRAFGLGGTARISAQASDSVLDQLLGRAGVTATSSAALPGSLGARASSALDGSSSTAWTNAFGGNVGSWIQVHSPAAATLSSLDLQVVADGLHSVPTALKLVVDGTKVRDIALPASTDRKAKDATVTLPVSFAPVTGHTFRFVITGERTETTTDYFKHTPQILPVAIAELGEPGLGVAAPAPRVQGGCRTDLLTVDGTPVPVRIAGTTAAAVARDGLQVQPCGPPLTLAAGTHVLRTARGVDTGVDLDQLLLSSTAGGGAASTADPFPGQVRTADAPHVQVTGEGPVSYDLSVTGATPGRPFWLVLGQSLSPGWQATVGGHALDEPQLVDGFANGWLVTPTSSTFDVSLRWTAQTKVWIGVAISAVALLVCVLMMLRPRRVTLGRPAPAAPSPGDDSLPALVAPWARDGRTRPLRRTAVAVLVSAALAAVLITPLVGGIVLAATLAAVLLPRGRLVLRAGSVGALAVSAAYVLEVQARYTLPDSSGWAQEFHKVAALSWVAVALLVADVLVGWARRDPPGEPGSDIVSSEDVAPPLT